MKYNLKEIYKFRYRYTKNILISLLSIPFMLTIDSNLWANEQQRLFKSAYYLGRGDTGIATADNHEAIYYNPAGLASGKGIYKETVLASPMVEISKDTKGLIRKVAIEEKSSISSLRNHIGKNQHLGIYNFTGVVFRRAALGMVLSNQTNILVSKSPDHGGLETVNANSATNKVFSCSIAEGFFDQQLLIGTTIKHITRKEVALDINLADAEDLEDDLRDDELIVDGAGYGADIGAIYRKKGARNQFSLGLTVQNIGNTNLKTTSDHGKATDLKQTFNLGIAFEIGTKFSTFAFLLDFRDIQENVEDNAFKRTHIGTEVSIRKFIGMTAGLNQGYPSIGFFLNLYLFRMDLGMYGQEMGERIGSRPDERYFLRIAAGF